MLRWIHIIIILFSAHNTRSLKSIRISHMVSQSFCLFTEFLKTYIWLNMLSHGTASNVAQCYVLSKHTFVTHLGNFYCLKAFLHTYWARVSKKYAVEWRYEQKHQYICTNTHDRQQVNYISHHMPFLALGDREGRNKREFNRYCKFAPSLFSIYAKILIYLRISK